MAIESACIPLPSEVIMPFAGALVVPAVALQYHRQPFSLWWVAAAGALGCNIGSTIAYLVGYHGGRPLAERWGSYVLVSRRDLDMADRFFARYGAIAIFVGRLLPVVRTFISLPAGIAGMRQLKFQVYTFLGSWPWCFALAYIGFKLGEQWDSDPRLREILHRFDAVIIAVLVLGALWYVRRHWRARQE